MEEGEAAPFVCSSFRSSGASRKAANPFNPSYILEHKTAGFREWRTASALDGRRRRTMGDSVVPIQLPAGLLAMSRGLFFGEFGEDLEHLDAERVAL